MYKSYGTGTEAKLRYPSYTILGISNKGKHLEKVCTYLRRCRVTEKRALPLFVVSFSSPF